MYPDIMFIVLIMSLQMFSYQHFACANFKLLLIFLECRPSVLIRIHGKFQDFHRISCQFSMESVRSMDPFSTGLFNEHHQTIQINIVYLKSCNNFYCIKCKLLWLRASAKWRKWWMNKVLCSRIQHFSYCSLVFSLLPVPQDASPQSGLLQSSLISLYTMYVTWSAMTNNPSKSFTRCH